MLTTVSLIKKESGCKPDSAVEIIVGMGLISLRK